jgi:hypothetical protein
MLLTTFTMKISEASPWHTTLRHIIIKRWLSATVLTLVIGMIGMKMFPEGVVVPSLHGVPDWLPEATSIWDYLAYTRDEGRLPPERPSIGALSSMGAKSSFRTNLREDQFYLMSTLAAG